MKGLINKNLTCWLLISIFLWIHTSQVSAYCLEIDKHVFLTKLPFFKYNSYFFVTIHRVRDDTFFRDLRSLTIILPNHDLQSLTIIVWKSEEKVSTITHDHDRRSFPDHLNMSNMAFHNINSIKTWQNMKMNKILRLFTETHFNVNNFMGKFPHN